MVRKISPADLVQRVLHLDGEPFSIAEFPYLRAIYNSPAKDVGLFTARQIAKSTFLASKLVANALTQPRGRQVLVSPLMEQAYVFSMQRLKDFIHHSPIIRAAIFDGPGKVDQVLRKEFTNGHMITLGYAQRTADRLRGQSIKDNGVLGFDEIQDIFPEVIPVVQELAFRAKNVTNLFCGTPKSTANHMEKMRAKSTGNEWAVKCHNMGCGHWNYEWTERNIGDSRVVCAKCQQPIDTNRGEWVRRRHLDLEKGRNARVTMESFRVPQLIVKPIMDDPRKWRELLDKLRNYSTEKFHNEVLGLPFDSATQPVTRDQVERCCDPARRNAIPDPTDTTVPGLVMGLDWAFLAENSFTFVVIGAWRTFPSKFDVYYWKIFRGIESDSAYQVDWVVNTVRNNDIQIVAADWGAGHVQNIQLANALGEDRVAQLWHTSRKGLGAMGSRAKWDPKGRKWHLARTRVLTDTFESIRRQATVLPRVEESQDLIDHILAVQMEHREETNTTFYTNIDPDDGLHALTFAELGGELLLRGSFDGHGGSEPVHAASASALPDSGLEDEFGSLLEDMDLYV